MILATSVTVDGKTTAHKIFDLLAACDVKTSDIAHAVPIRVKLDYLD